MKNAEWIDTNAACTFLGVKPQTLYAYVSRHRVRTKADPDDARSSFYYLPDLERLLAQNRRPRARADVAQAAIRWGDPVLTTSISEVRDGTIWLKGRPIEDCARQDTLEETASLLCGCGRVVLAKTHTPPPGTTPFTRAMKALADEADGAPPITHCLPTDIALEVGKVLSLVTNACLGEAVTGEVHQRIASKWGISRQGTDVVRQALVLLSDHELNPSTFAVRVCASTSTSLSAALLAGVATLSGPLHGGVASLAGEALNATIDGGLDRFLEQRTGQSPYSFGFGHPLYPAGDPRAAYLLDLIPKGAPVLEAIDRASDRLSHRANIDTALAAIACHFAWPAEAATIIFTVGRTAGWSAHAIEQAKSGTLIRPRAQFQPKQL